MGTIRKTSDVLMRVAECSAISLPQTFVESIQYILVDKSKFAVGCEAMIWGLGVAL